MLVRTPERWAVAIRRTDSSIHTEAHLIEDRWPRLRGTVLRGPLALVDAVSVGMRALTIAMREASGTQVAPEQLSAAFAPVAIGVLAVFIVAPGLVAFRFAGITADVVEAATRAGVLVVYLLALSRSAQTRRLFAYHGAEHMAIAAFERHRRLPTADEVAAESPIHARCGTNFIAIFVMASGVLFSFVPRHPLWLGAVSRVALVPVVAALSYEVMRLAARTAVAGPISWPGRALQRITTRRPAPDQVEIALAALATAVAAPGVDSER